MLSTQRHGMSDCNRGFVQHLRRFPEPLAERLADALLQMADWAADPWQCLFGRVLPDVAGLHSRQAAARGRRRERLQAGLAGPAIYAAERRRRIGGECLKRPPPAR